MKEPVSALWTLGDWQALSEYRSDLALPALNVAAYADEPSALRDGLLHALRSGASLDDATRYLISGICNSFARFQALRGGGNEARDYFYQSLAVVTGECAAETLVEARRTEQLRQIGIGAVWSPAEKPVETLVDVSQALRELHEASPQEPAILIALAEKAHMAQDFEEAIRLWQKLADELGTAMPQVYYERLREAYSRQKRFPRGTPDEEKRSGDGDKHEILKRIHREFQPETYFEVGVQKGKSLFLAACPALGIDPMPMVESPLPDHFTLVRCSSDRFFEMHADVMLWDKLDLVFIDGMHLFEYALRDFINVEKYADAATLVVIDDIFPNHPAQAERDRRTRTWTGDVWKLYDILEHYRPEIALLPIDANPTGLLLVTNLDPANTTLTENYDEVVAEYRNQACVPDRYISREKAVSAATSLIAEKLQDLRNKRESCR